jgi:hypothetical protein
MLDLYLIDGAVDLNNLIEEVVEVHREEHPRKLLSVQEDEFLHGEVCLSEEVHRH